MKIIRKMFSAAISVVIILQSAPAVLAGWEADTDNVYTLYSTDFSDITPGEIVDGKQLYQPAGWKIDKLNSDWELKAYADVVSDGSGQMTGAPYFRIYNNGEQRMSESVKAEKEFASPESIKGIFRTKFKYSTNHGNYAAQVKLADKNNKGISISSGWSGEWINNSVDVDGEPQTPYGTGQWRIFVDDLLGTGNSGAYAIGTANSSDDAAWRYFDIAANTSNSRVVTEVAGKSISLGGRVYAVAMTCGGETNILKGVLPSGTESFCKFTLTSPGWFQGNEVRLDSVSIDFTPVVYIDNSFSNKATIKCGGMEITEPSGLGSEIQIENKLFNKSLNDKDSAVLAALYRNGYMINAAAGIADSVPHSATGDENVYKELNLTLSTPPEDIFGEMSLSVYTLDSLEKIGARCTPINITGKTDLEELTEETTEPVIDEATNRLTYCGRTNGGSDVTYAVLKNGIALSADMTGEEFCDALYYFGETAANAAGEYAFSIKFAGTDADYTLVINDGESIKNYSLTFKNTLAENIAGEINDISTADGVKVKLDAFLEAVQFSNSLYNSNLDEIKSGELFYRIFLDEIKKNPVSTSDDVVRNAKLSALMFALGRETNQSGIEKLLSGNIDMVDISRIYAEELYSDDVLTDDGIKGAIFRAFAEASLKNTEILTDIEKFLDALGDSTVLALCEKTAGSEAGSRIIELMNKRLGKTSSEFAGAYQLYSGFDSKKRNTASSSIMRKKYENISGLAKAFSDAVSKAQLDNDSAVKKPSGGGGGKSSSFVPAAEKQPDLIPPSYVIPEKAQAAVFSDIKEAEWAEKFIQNLSERGVVSGDESGKFYPNRNISREEFVKMLVKALGIETVYVGSSFSDVPPDAWFYEYVSAAYANGIVTGIDGEHFGAGQKITREDMCTMICRALEKYGVYIPDAEDEPFADDSKLSGYAKHGVYAMKRLGVLDGFPDGSFGPDKNASRAETAKILSAVLEYMEAEQNNTEESYE